MLYFIRFRLRIQHLTITTCIMDHIYLLYAVIKIYTVKLWTTGFITQLLMSSVDILYRYIVLVLIPCPHYCACLCWYRDLTIVHACVDTEPSLLCMLVLKPSPHYCACLSWCRSLTIVHACLDTETALFTVCICIRKWLTLNNYGVE